MSGGRTYQQNLVWERLSDGLEAVEAANDKLESRASAIIAGSTAAIAAVTGVNLFPASMVQVSIVDAIFLALLCFLLLLMYWVAAKAWGPRAASIPTGWDVKLLYDEYIAKDENVAFNNALIDMAKAFEHSVWVNVQKGRQVRNMFVVLQAQIVVLALGVISRGAQPYVGDLLRWIQSQCGG